MLYESRVKLTGTNVKFPEYTGERVYMAPFSPDQLLPDELLRWQGVVDHMMEGVDTHEECYLMIDQQFVKANSYHRRGGMHIDGYWNADMEAHGRGHTGGGGHGSDRRWQPFPPSHKPSKRTQAIVGWGDSAFEEPEAIILATNVEATMAYAGQFYGPVGDGGDCSDIRTPTPLEEVWLEAGNVYAGNVTMLHQTHPVPVDCYRTVVRINAPGWEP